MRHRLCAAVPLIPARIRRATEGKCWQTLDNEVLLAPDLKSALHGATGVELRQVLSSLDSHPLPWFQVIPLHELPPMAPTTIGIYQPDRSRVVAPCPRCHRDAYFTRMVYRIRYELDLASVPDVSHTHEHFGRSGLHEPFAKSHFAQPLADRSTPCLRALDWVWHEGDSRRASRHCRCCRLVNRLRQPAGRAFWGRSDCRSLVAQIRMPSQHHSEC
jgi:hypothetical protein